MKSKYFCIILCLAFTQGGSTDYPFRNISLSWKERVEDLVSRLTLDEIVDQIAYGGRVTHAPAIDRLGIKPYGWGVECLRGDVEAGPATSFPQALGLAASFSEEVVFLVARATALEVRAKNNNYTAHGYYGQHTGISCWSPVINIMRDPRWGRNQETYGEDPYMSGVLSKAFVQGLQGDHPRYLLTNAGCKHYAVYAGPENIPVSRLQFDAVVSEYDLRMTFLPQFKACVEAGTYSIMCSYNSVNGIPACANKKLLTDILRKEWGFEGYVISDEGAIEAILAMHKYTTNKEDTAAAAILAGTNLEDGPIIIEPYLLAAKDAVKSGKLTMEDVKTAVKPLFYTRMRLGEFDPPKMNPYTKLDPTKLVQSESHRKIAVEAAMKTFVLLKNTNNFLPLSKGKVFNKIAIVGPLANNVYGMYGGYAPTPDPRFVTTPYQGLKGMGNRTTLAAGCKNYDPKCKDYDANEVKYAVTGSELVILCLGTGSSVEQEENDRADIDLPGKQLQLLQDAVKYAKGAPVLLVLFNAGPLDISWAQQSPKVMGILECFFPAQTTGDALFRTIYNLEPSANPAGRLPATWPMSLKQIPAITNYTMEGRTYRYMTEAPLYPFGYGLSYTTFKYRSLSVSPYNVSYGVEIQVEVYVENTGPYDGDEVVQVYVNRSAPSLPVPQLQLVGFRRVRIASGEGMSCHFAIKREQLAVWDDAKMDYVDMAGPVTVYVGGQQPFQKVNVGSNILKAKAYITS